MFLFVRTTAILVLLIVALVVWLPAGFSRSREFPKISLPLTKHPRFVIYGTLDRLIRDVSASYRANRKVLAYRGHAKCKTIFKGKISMRGDFLK